MSSVGACLVCTKFAAHKEENGPMNSYRRNRIQRSHRTLSVLLDAPICPHCAGTMTVEAFHSGALQVCESCKHQVAVFMPTA